MLDFHKLIAEYQNCPCGQAHECAIDDIVIESGAVHHVGEILARNDFPRRLLVVADKTTLAAADGILESLTGFDVTLKIYDTLRVATMDDVRAIEGYFDRCDAVLAVGTGSIHDPCRFACARQDKKLALFATAPSMDGFASYSAPIVDGNFKTTHPAKCPEVIIADTKILAAAPAQIKAAGFGDMVSKYVALIDWQVSHLLTGESYCQRVADLTRMATDRILTQAELVTAADEDAAGAIFESLLLTGIAMSFTKTSRPGSGTEHILAHYWECKELLEGKVPNFHGEDVGVATLLILDYYDKLAHLPSVTAHREENDWDEIYRVYGALAPDVRRLNTPDTITDAIDPRMIEENWQKIVEIVRSVPTAADCRAAMHKAGCKLTPDEIGKSPDFIAESFRYHPYMRRRLSLKRVSHMLDLPAEFH